MKNKLQAGFIKFESILFSSKVALILFIEIILGVFSSGALALLFAKLSTEIFDKEITFYDQLISNFVNHLRSPFLTKIMLFITNLGADYTLIGLVVIILFLIWKHHKKEAFLFSLITLMGLLINLALKTLIQRPRPLLSPLISAPYYSFPSGHAMNSFIFYATLSYYIYHFTRNKKISTIVSSFSILLIGLIGFSRVYLGVHYPTDIIAGYFIGFWWFVTVLLIEKTITFMKLFKEYPR